MDQGRQQRAQMVVEGKEPKQKCLTPQMVAVGDEWRVWLSLGSLLLLPKSSAVEFDWNQVGAWTYCEL
jgi:hypothetical protein